MENVKFNEQGLISVIAQDAETGTVLMLAWMNEEALKLTLESGKMHYFSRSRQKLWLKGETSGNFQTLCALHYDCDGDCLLAKVRQEGVACHTGTLSCFDGRMLYGEEQSAAPASAIVPELYQVVLDRKNNPQEGSYTNKLLTGGVERIAKKVGEEASEVIIGAMKRDKAEVAYEAADLMYHLSVLLVDQEMEWADIYRELKGRRK